MQKTLYIELPEGVRCVVALTYDTDMAAGYSPDGICHGRTAPFLQNYIFTLCDVAESYGVRLHLFQIANGLEISEDTGYLQRIIERGHLVDCHTYNHLNLAYTPAAELDEDLMRADRLFRERLGYKSRVLRGPGGYRHGELPTTNQQVILKYGYRWVSGEVDYELPQKDEQYMVSASSRGLPSKYPNGLIEVPIQGWTDRMWFDGYKCIDPQAYAKWRREWGHRAVPDGWQCPWTAPDALDEWIRINLATLDYAYQHRLSWVICWHPYSHYLHDRECRMLRAFLEAVAAKPQKIWVCTLMDFIGLLMEVG